MIFNDFMKALGQIDDAKFRNVLLRAIGLTAMLLAAFVFASAGFLGWLLPDNLSLPWIGEITFLDELGAGLGLGAGLILSVFLMIPVASLFIGFFLDAIAGAVEAKHYPHLAPAKGLPIFQTIRDSLRFLGLVILVNVLAIVLYIIFAPLAPLIFWGVNGLLLGREYFQLVATRRMSLKDANKLRSKNFLPIWMAGTLMAVPLTIPVLNLIVPILGVATFTHQFHRVWRT